MNLRPFVDFDFGVDYSTDVDRVTAVLRDIAENHPKTLEEPKPFVGMSQHGDSAAVFTARVWVNKADYWPVYFDIMEQVKKRFDAENISMPFLQLDVHMAKE